MKKIVVISILLCLILAIGNVVVLAQSDDDSVVELDYKFNALSNNFENLDIVLSIW